MALDSDQPGQPASRGERARFRSVGWSAVVVVLLVSAGCRSGATASSRAAHRPSAAAVRASQQAALDTYLNGHIRPLFVRQLREKRAMLPALAVYSRAPTRVDERAASRAVERMEVKERVLSDLIDSVVAPVPLRDAQLTLGEAFHSEDDLLTILIYDIPHRPPARVLRVAREFRILIRPPVRSWLRSVVRYAHERHLEVPAWLAPSGGSPNGGSGSLAALRVVPPASIGSVSS